MTTRKPRRWRASTWVRNEIEANIDSYNNTPKQAAEFVIDLLKEGEYDDELTWRQAAAAIRAAQNQLEKL